MRTIFTLASGTFEPNTNIDGWIITSDEAIAIDNDDLILLKGDRIDHNGDVWRGEFRGVRECVGNVW